MSNDFNHTKKPIFEKLDAQLSLIEKKVDRLQINPPEYPKPSAEELKDRIRIVPLPEGKGHYWDMDSDLMRELYPTGWVHKVHISKKAASGNPQIVLILGAQTAKRDFLEAAKWTSELIGNQERKVMKDNLTIYCIDVLGPPSKSDIWKQTQQDDLTFMILNSDFAQGIYETTSIENFLSRINHDSDYKMRFEGKELHIVAEGVTDYLSEETLNDLLTFACSRAVKSITLRTIVPTSDDEYMTPGTIQVIIDSLRRDLGINIDCSGGLANQTNNPLPANDIEGIVKNAWKTSYSVKQRRQKGLDIAYPGNHLRPQDVISAFRLLGKKVQYNLFSTIGGYPKGVSIVIN